MLWGHHTRRNFGIRGVAPSVGVEIIKMNKSKFINKIRQLKFINKIIVQIYNIIRGNARASCKFATLHVETRVHRANIQQMLPTKIN